ncbi:pathogen-related protein PR10 [Artemisia annua]|uniref:Pathogen-related protein PR10 n=1 Tax=Artemisia annua TaxID=35608 RepID=A0A2U1NGS1_ARTAN|nr:pathogen-related protein PR10 [Artemisia annua]
MFAVRSNIDTTSFGASVDIDPRCNEISLRNLLIRAVINNEIEVRSSLSVDKLFKLFHGFEILAPKVESQTFKAINLIQDDGGVGSIKSTTWWRCRPIHICKVTRLMPLTQATLALPVRFLKVMLSWAY